MKIEDDIVVTGDCVCCGRHIEDSKHIFLCEDCRQKEEEHLQESGKENDN